MAASLAFQFQFQFDAAAATTLVYVDSAAPAGGNGSSPSSAYKNLNTAVYEAAATTGSDPIVVRVSGTFNETLKIMGPHSDINPPSPYAQGPRVKNITIEKAPGASTATIRGNALDVYGIRIRGSYGVTLKHIVVNGGVVVNSLGQRIYRYDRAISVERSHHVVLENCHGANAKDFGFRVENGGGNSDFITLTYCSFNNNGMDGVSIFGDKGVNPIDTVGILMLSCSGNLRQGMKSESVRNLSLNGGTFTYNKKTGVQIEGDSKFVTLVDVLAAYNNDGAGEAGIWIDEASNVGLVRCTASNNHFNIAVSQSENVTLDDCDIKNAKTPSAGGSWGGLRVNTGAHHYPPGAPSYSGQPMGGVRLLRVKSNCTFSNNGNADPIVNNKGDIFYGDTEGTTPYDRMNFSDNKVHVNCKVDNGVPINSNDLDDYFDLPRFDPGASGYNASNHQPLSFIAF